MAAKPTHNVGHCVNGVLAHLVLPTFVRGIGRIEGHEQLVAQDKGCWPWRARFTHDTWLNVPFSVPFLGQFIVDVRQPEDFAELTGHLLGPVFARATLLGLEEHPPMYSDNYFSSLTTIRIPG